MMDVITGKTRPDKGTVLFREDIDLTRHDEPEIARLGIGRKFQKPTVFESLTVFENLELALKGERDLFRTLLVRPDRRAARPDRRGAAASSGLERVRAAPGRRAQPRPEAVAGDRHAAGAGPGAAAGRRAGGRHDRRRDRAHGASCCADRRQPFASSWSSTTWSSCASIAKVTVLHEGSVLAEGSLDQVQNDQRVIEVYLGR